MKKLTAVLLCMMMLFGTTSFCAVGADDWVDSGINYGESLETFNTNPARGWAPYRWYTLRKNGNSERMTDYGEYGMYCPKFDLGDFSAGTDRIQDGYPEDHSSQVGGEDLPLTDEALQAIRDTFEAAREQGVYLIPSFGYTSESFCGVEPSDFNMLLHHMEQFIPIINEYKDVVISVECGMVGPWGEMHSSDYQGKEYIDQILDMYLDNLDESITLQVRHMGFVIQYAKTIDIGLLKMLPFDKDSKLYRLGMYNHGYLGTSGDYGTWSANSTSRSNGVQILQWQLHVPYGGELAYTTAEYMKANGSPVYEDWLVEELYETHLNYLYNIVNGPDPCEELEKIPLGHNHDFAGMPDVSAYYGQSLQKFMYDHMGYRFVIRAAQTTGSVSKGGTVKLKGTVENTGFGNLLPKMTTELIVVDADGEETVIPSQIDARNWTSGLKSYYIAELTVPRDARAGEYKVYLRMGTLGYAESGASSNKRTVHFANDGIWNSTYAANYIGSFTVKDQVSGSATAFAQVAACKDGHTFGAWKTVVEPNCNVGIEQRVCEVCGFCQLNHLPAHDYDTKWTIDRAATDKIPGSKSHHCKRCGEQTDNTLMPKLVNVGDTFPDVQTDKWYYEAVDYAVNHELFNGTSDTTFAPNNVMNRGMLVSVLYRMEGSPEVNAQDNVFTDVAAGKYYTDAVIWASSNEIVNGTGEGVFSPTNNITREQMAAILYRYTQYKGFDTSKSANLNSFPDGGKTSNYAKEALAWANAEELISGTTSGSEVILNPKGSATRAQVATILMRYEKSYLYN